MSRRLNRRQSGLLFVPNLSTYLKHSITPYSGNRGKEKQMTFKENCREKKCKLKEKLKETYYQSVPPPSFIFPVSGQLRRSNSSSFSSQRCVQGRSKPGKWATHQAFCHQTPFTCLPTPRSRTQLGHSFSQKYIRWSGAAPLHAFAPHSFCIYAAFVVLLEEAKTGTR